MKKKSAVTCEMCGTEMFQSTTIKVEGALLNVCSRCSYLGHVVKPPSKPVGQGIKTQKRGTSKFKRSSPSSSMSKSHNAEKELMADFASVIRNARMKQKFTQEQLATKTGLSIPFIRSIESGKMRPTDSAAKKLERELGIELLFIPEQELEHGEKSKNKGTTLGDIAVIKRFDYE